MDVVTTDNTDMDGVLHELLDEGSTPDYANRLDRDRIKDAYGTHVHTNLGFGDEPDKWIITLTVRDKDNGKSPSEWELTKWIQNDIQLFREVFRKYVLFTEVGEKTLRPHAHGLFVARDIDHMDFKFPRDITYDYLQKWLRGDKAYKWKEILGYVMKRVWSHGHVNIKFCEKPLAAARYIAKDGKIVDAYDDGHSIDTRIFEKGEYLNQCHCGKEGCPPRIRGN